MAKHLTDLLELKNIKYDLIKAENDNNPLINAISYNSKTTEPGNIFVCLVGENFDAHKFVDDAILKGAVAVIAQKNIKGLSVPVVVVENTAKVMAVVATEIYDNPSKRIRLIGITGTNGKTTVTHLVEKILEKNKKKCGLIGTLGHRFKSTDKYLNSKHTTPQAPELQSYLAEMVDQKFDYTVMEVSSHALDLHRVQDCHFAVALITNLTQDHLDFHVTMENYASAKLKLFSQLAESELENKTAIINIDDNYAGKFLEIIPDNITKLTYGLASDADIQAVDIEYSVNGTVFTCVAPEKTFKVNLKLKGLFSVYNALSAISVSIAEKVPPEIICEALEEIENIPGRFETVSSNPLIIVDYAHTPDGLSNVLTAARKLVPDGGELITLFGCGGDRDPTKRPKMAKIVEDLSDKIIVTSDNPRTEDPQQIITDILTGIKSLGSSHVKVEIDRALAIEMAIKSAKPDDVIVVAGKGHEDYQILADRTIHFDDREEVKKVIEKLNLAKSIST
ncbi:MAG: UDP-N-acetylmuramoyl-L-alanyl-D-glutamate--2,6-diaminopimelate ligase [Cyanobacteriota bacterium]